MAGLKHELDQWNEGVIAFDQGLYEDALEIFEPIADSAKIHFNIGVVLTTLGDFEGASAAYEEATKLDQYLAIAYFQNGVANVALENYSKALSCFHDAYLYLRGNMVIDYTQLGLDFKLYSCQVLFNRALCYIELGEMDLGMTDLWRATREKQTKAHDMMDQALRDKGQDCTVFTVPQGVLYRPAESKVKNSKKKDYLGNSKVIAAVDASDQFAGFKGKSAWQVQMSGPTNVAAVEEPRSMTPPNGLQRRATERAAPGKGIVAGRAIRGVDSDRPHMLEHSASFNGMDSMAARRGGPPGGANGPAGSEPYSKPSTLSRRNTEMQRPSPLNLDASVNRNNRNGPSSAAPGGGGGFPQQQQQPQPGRGRFQDELDEIDQHVYALSLDSDRQNNKNMSAPIPTMASSQDLRAAPLPARSNSSAAVRQGMPRKGSVPNVGPTSPLAGPIGNGNSVTPVLAELRRKGSGGARGLRREDSVRSASSNGMYSSTTSLPVNASPLGYNQSGSNSVRSDEGSSYLDEPAYAGLRDKLRVKCHYVDTRAVLVRADTPLKELVQRIQEKFQADRPLRLKYKDEDHHMLSMIDDEDWLMAQQFWIQK
ncbi:hypothetical protein BGX28_008829 [Mortierella sp. GBA30]|nr:hypothetical protein BGX28_008829 [Mortierella sp. GBA30]